MYQINIKKKTQNNKLFKLCIEQLDLLNIRK